MKILEVLRAMGRTMSHHLKVSFLVLVSQRNSLLHLCLVMIFLFNSGKSIGMHKKFVVDRSVNLKSISSNGILDKSLIKLLSTLLCWQQGNM